MCSKLKVFFRLQLCNIGWQPFFFFFQQVVLLYVSAAVVIDSCPLMGKVGKCLFVGLALEGNVDSCCRAEGVGSVNVSRV